MGYKGKKFIYKMKMFLKSLCIFLGCAYNVNSVDHSGLTEPNVNIANASNFAILAKSGITTVPESVIKGDIAVSPIDSTAMTGFSFILDQSGTFAKSSQLQENKAYAANYKEPVPERLTVSVLDMESAYTDAAGRVNNDASRINLGNGQLGGVFGGWESPLTPGIYTFGSDVTIAETIYLQGNDYSSGYDVFIIQMTGNLVMSTNTKVILLDGVLAENVFWQVAGNVKIMVGAHLVGVILAKTDVTFLTGSSLQGRVLTQTACNLQMATIDAS
jgi:hypothetical protein